MNELRWQTLQVLADAREACTDTIRERVIASVLELKVHPIGLSLLKLRKSGYITKTAVATYAITDAGKSVQVRVKDLSEHKISVGMVTCCVA